MSQWGKERTINGVRLTPHVDGPTWEPLHGHQIIDDVMLVDDGGNRGVAMATLKVAKRTMVGKSYDQWLLFDITFDDPTQPND